MAEDQFDATQYYEVKKGDILHEFFQTLAGQGNILLLCRVTTRDPDNGGFRGDEFRLFQLVERG